MADKLGWQKDENLVSPSRFDCQIHAILDYMYNKKLGFSEKDELYSKMIREGILSRDEALKRLEQEKNDEQAQLDIISKVFEKLNLTKEKKSILLLLSSTC